MSQYVKGHVSVPEKDVLYRLFMVNYKDGSADIFRVIKEDKEVRSIVEYDESNHKAKSTRTYG